MNGGDDGTRTRDLCHDSSVQVCRTRTHVGVPLSKKRQDCAAAVDWIKHIESGRTLLYSVSNGILLSLKELRKTRRFESLLRHQVITARQGVPPT
jgi:hypothetical protein